MRVLPPLASTLGLTVLASILAVTVVALPAPAQGLTPLTIYPEDTGLSASYASRPDWANSGEALIEVADDLFRGVGDGSGQCLVHGFHHFAIDENLSTAETYGVVLRKVDTSARRPDASASGILTKISGLTTPTAFGRGFSRMRDVFQTPVQVPCAGTFYAGIDFPANAKWPGSDGHSLFAAWVGQPVGEHPRPSYPRDVTWTNQAGTPPWSVSATYLMGVLLDKPVLQVGGVDPRSCRNGATLCGTANFGLGGLFADVSGNPRSDGVTLRIKDATNPSANLFLFLSPGFGNALPLGILTGQVHLDANLLLSIGGLPLTNGVIEHPLIAPGGVPPQARGQAFMFQAVVMSGIRTLTLTNAQAITF